jgi:hypothetical protein
LNRYRGDVLFFPAAINLRLFGGFGLDPAGLVGDDTLAGKRDA